MRERRRPLGPDPDGIGAEVGKRRTVAVIDGLPIPSPLVGEGKGGGRFRLDEAHLSIAATPLPSPPPQGGRECADAFHGPHPEPSQPEKPAMNSATWPRTVK